LSLKTGEYDIACAEMCGTHHYIMKGKLTVYTQSEFKKWIDRANELALSESDPEDLNRYWGWKWEE
jgi:cytochrome c oxidase subunit 2